MPSNPLLRVVLNSECYEQERETATALAQAAGKSVSGWLRGLIRREMLKAYENADKNLFRPLLNNAAKAKRRAEYLSAYKKEKHHE